MHADSIVARPVQGQYLHMVCGIERYSASTGFVLAFLLMIAVNVRYSHHNYVLVISEFDKNIFVVLLYPSYLR